MTNSGHDRAGEAGEGSGDPAQESPESSEATARRVGLLDLVLRLVMGAFILSVILCIDPFSSIPLPDSLGWLRWPGKLAKWVVDFPATSAAFMRGRMPYWAWGLCFQALILAGIYFRLDDVFTQERTSDEDRGFGLICVLVLSPLVVAGSTWYDVGIHRAGFPLLVSGGFSLLVGAGWVIVRRLRRRG